MSSRLVDRLTRTDPCRDQRTPGWGCRSVIFHLPTRLGGAKQDISRVLFTPRRGWSVGWVAIYLGPPLPTVERRVQAERGQWPAVVPWPCSSRGSTMASTSDAQVRSYRTFAPPPVRQVRPSAVCSLWHSPHGHPLGVTQTSLAIRGPDFPQPDHEIDRMTTFACFLHPSCPAGNSGVWGCSSANQSDGFPKP